MGVTDGYVDPGQRLVLVLDSQLSTNPHNVDRKLDFLVKELKMLDVAIAGIQETKWIGKDAWNATSATHFFTLGVQYQMKVSLQVRNEGVGIVLNEQATAAWKDAGENGRLLVHE